MSYNIVRYVSDMTPCQTFHFYPLVHYSINFDEIYLCTSFISEDTIIIKFCCTEHGFFFNFIWSLECVLLAYRKTPNKRPLPINAPPPQTRPHARSILTFLAISLPKMVRFSFRKKLLEGKNATWRWREHTCQRHDLLISLQNCNWQLPSVARISELWRPGQVGSAQALNTCYLPSLL